MFSLTSVLLGVQIKQQYIYNISLISGGLCGNTNVQQPSVSRGGGDGSVAQSRHTAMPQTAPIQYTSAPTALPQLASHLTVPTHYQTQAGFYNSVDYSTISYPKQPLTSSHQLQASAGAQKSAISSPVAPEGTQHQYSPTERLVTSSSGSPTEPQNLSLIPQGDQRGEGGRFAGPLPNIHRDRARSGSASPHPGPSSRQSPMTYNSPRRNDRSTAASPGVNGSAFQSFRSSPHHPYYVPSSTYTPQGNYSAYSTDPGLGQYVPQGYYAQVTSQANHQQETLAYNQSGGTNMSAGNTSTASQQLPSFPTLSNPNMPAPQVFGRAEGETQGIIPPSSQVDPTSGMRVPYFPRYPISHESAEAFKREHGTAIREHFQEYNGSGLGMPLHASRNFATSNNSNNNVPRPRAFVADRESTCPLCHVTFASSGHLKRHLQSHGSGRRFKCTDCDCAYSRQDNLKKHMGTAHNKGPEVISQRRRQPPKHHSSLIA